MKVHHLPLFIPLVFFFVWLEYQYKKQEDPKAFRFESTVLNICIGLIERIVDVYVYVGLFFLLTFVKSQYGILNLSGQQWWHWIVCFVLLDFLIYWFHRGGHRINFLWAAHVTHHQCEEYNLTVAFRNNILPSSFRAIWFCSLALLGFSPYLIIICLSVSGIWQILLHTTVIKRLGWLERFMVTPSAHRVHHASNEQYLDKNFGAVFIIWDKCLGTYEPEQEPVKYGLTQGFESLNPIQAYTHVWKDLWQASWKVKSFRELIKIWFGKPEEFYNRYMKSNQVDNPSMGQANNNHKISAPLIYYVTLQLIIISGLAIVVLAYAEFLSSVHLFLSSAGLILSAISICMLMEGHASVFKLEKLRLVLIACSIPLFLPLSSIYIFLLLVMIASIFIGLDYVEVDWIERKIRKVRE